MGNCAKYFISVTIILIVCFILATQITNLDDDAWHEMSEYTDFIQGEWRVVAVEIPGIYRSDRQTYFDALQQKLSGVIFSENTLYLQGLDESHEMGDLFLSEVSITDFMTENYGTGIRYSDAPIFNSLQADKLFILESRESNWKFVRASNGQLLVKYLNVLIYLER